jgi:hypothetical protein
MCSWCQRVEVKGRWMPVETAVAALGLMAAPTVPAISHGICDACYERAMSQL